MTDKLFQKNPDDYKSKIEDIQDDAIKKLYSLEFKYCKFTEQTNQQNDSNENHIISYLSQYLKTFKLITYHFPKISLPSNELDLNPKTNCIFCLEGECIIIEQIDKTLIEQLIKELQKQNPRKSLNNIINANDISDEIQQFCKEYEREINQNTFVKNTIDSIVGYSIHRHFYPSNYFKDSTFFNFDKIIGNENGNISNCKYEFKKEDFIILKTITVKQNYGTFYLVIHKKTLYVFMMKKFYDKKSLTITKEMNREIEFCKKYSHYCLNRFYGFLNDNSGISGLIYEYMSNGDLETYLKDNEVDDIYRLISLYRIIEGINYLHKNSLIHRDIKSWNILINHDYLPFISDFETIRSPPNDKSKEDYILTIDVGSPSYTSPEQDMNENVSYPTDIYSFGLIIYFLFENEHMWSCYSVKNTKIKTMTNGMMNLQTLYKNCVCYEPKDRLKIASILHILKTEFEFCFANFNEPYKIFVDCINLQSTYIKELEAKKDFSIVKKHFEQSAKYNNSNALFYLGYLYFEGLGVKKDNSMAIKYFKQSAKLGNSDALAYFGKFYYEGLVVKQDYSVAKNYFEQSAKLGNSNALISLGYLYFNGLGVKKNYSIALNYYEQSAKLGNPDALFSLGKLNFEGLGVKRDYFVAIEYLKQSAKLNNPFALFYLGKLYYEGLGVEKNYSIALNYFEQSAKLGNPDALANLGYHYFEGFGVKKDYSMAKNYFEQSAKFNNPNALVGLGYLYFEGLGVKQDYSMAINYFKQSAKLDNPEALFCLGRIYFEGLIVKQNYSIAKNYFEQSAKFNNPNALFCLAKFYFEGLGVYQDYSMAIKYLEQSAKLGHSHALSFLRSFS